MEKMPIMYSTGCPKCEVLKQKMIELGCGFQLCTDIQEMIRLGINEVPMLKVDDVMMNFSEALKWIEEQKEKV